MPLDVLGFPAALDAAPELDFIRNYGAPFAVWTRPDRGLLCLGVEGPRYGRLLIRFAGAAVTGGIPPQAAVAHLRGALPAYEALYGHPALIRLQGHGPAAGGYMAIFRWAEGWSLDQEEARAQLRRQPLLTRLRMMDSVVDFHLHALARGYVSVGFSDASLIADLGLGTVTIGDIDFYRPLPAVNDMGRMVGSVRFLSPEEYQLGAALDERTVQYTLGALAFFFFGEYGSRERPAWTAGEALYQVAARACQEQRDRRYPTLSAFAAAWREAAGKTV